MKTEVHIVWFKRDLRVHDHAALYEACRLGKVLPIFVWDDAIWHGQEYVTQHRCFVEECLASLTEALQALGLTLYVFQHSVLAALSTIEKQYRIAQLHSHEETGNDASYRIDQLVSAWCLSKRVKWTEYPQTGVVRRLKSRDTWAAIWERRMSSRPYSLPENARLAPVDARADRKPISLGLYPDKPLRQRGGREAATKLLGTFINGRASRYSAGISSPITSELTGARLSPYLTWGVLSMREVVQALRAQQARIDKQPAIYPKGLSAGLAACESRLHWHCHFIQKLESEPSIEFKNLHSAFNGLRDPHYEDATSAFRLKAWKNAQTGWPLVDACMVMLNQTGWINFRMRAMLMSVASYLLWLHWRETGLHLAREFLDYEPGIHWSQVQMQSGTTGINTLRIYNPVKQAMQQDPEGVFVRRWIPALKHVPNSWIFEPWLMPPGLQQAYHCNIGIDYPAPLVEIKTALALAKHRFSQLQHNAQTRDETRRVIKMHASRKGMVKRTSKSTTKTTPNIPKSQLSLF